MLFDGSSSSLNKITALTSRCQATRVLCLPTRVYVYSAVTMSRDTVKKKKKKQAVNTYAKSGRGFSFPLLACNDSCCSLGRQYNIRAGRSVARSFLFSVQLLESRPRQSGGIPPGLH